MSTILYKERCYNMTATNQIITLVVKMSRPRKHRFVVKYYKIKGKIRHHVYINKIKAKLFRLKIHAYNNQIKNALANRRFAMYDLGGVHQW